MQKINPAGFITTKIKKLSTLSIQDGFLAFDEKPSDKYDQAEPCSPANDIRINAFELFSLFTADIIKKEVLFIR